MLGEKGEVVDWDGKWKEGKLVGRWSTYFQTCNCLAASNGRLAVTSWWAAPELTRADCRGGEQ